MKAAFGVCVQSDTHAYHLGLGKLLAWCCNKILQKCELLQFGSAKYAHMSSEALSAEILITNCFTIACEPENSQEYQTLNHTASKSITCN